MLSKSIVTGKSNLQPNVIDREINIIDNEYILFDEVIKQRVVGTYTFIMKIIIVNYIYDK